MSGAAQAGRYALGIDIGGTFTDVVVHDREARRQLSRKLLTTHGDPARAVVEGVAEIVDGFALAPAAFGRVVHATTLFTNALIERRGARTGLLTTAGFRDVVEIGRERKYTLYDLAIAKPEPLAPRELRAEVDERVAADGRVLRPLDEAGLLAAAAALVARGVESLAVVFLHAYRNPAHERRALELLGEAHPELALTASHEVAPEIREFERASTALANAYVKPLAARYLDRLAEGLGALGIGAEPSMMISSGGLTHLAEAKRTPVQMLESGPAAGALAAAHFGSADADGRVLAFDMGGTTAKLSLVDGGEPLVSYGFEAARQQRFIEHSGLPVRISTIELIEIGAGGGSIAGTDRLGLVKVGPLSAGSEPGPAAYGRGGEEATVTDADLALGYLDPARFAGGTMRLDMDASRAALARTATQAGMSVEALAWGIHDIVNENMASAARVHFAERGREPSRYTLLCTGGAGPVHAWYLAKKLRIPAILCPPEAGVASALGLLVAPARVDRVASVGFRVDRDPPAALEQAFAALEREARAVFAEGGLDAGAMRVRRRVDGRFVGQGYDLTVTLPDGPYDARDAAPTRARLVDAFERAYREQYARTPRDVPLEFMNVRIAAEVAIAGGAADDAAEVAIAGSTADGAVAPESVGAAPAPGGPATAAASAPPATRSVWWREASGFADTAVYPRGALASGRAYRGPAVIEESGSTLLVGPGGAFRVLPSGNLRVDIDGSEEDTA